MATRSPPRAVWRAWWSLRSRSHVPQGLGFLRLRCTHLVPCFHLPSPCLRDVSTCPSHFPSPCLLDVPTCFFHFPCLIEFLTCPFPYLICLLDVLTCRFTFHASSMSPPVPFTFSFPVPPLCPCPPGRFDLPHLLFSCSFDFPSSKPFSASSSSSCLLVVPHDQTGLAGDNKNKRPSVQGGWKCRCADRKAMPVVFTTAALSVAASRCGAMMAVPGVPPASGYGSL